MPFVRVLAVMIDDGEHKEDLKSKVVFQLKTGTDGQLDLSAEAFGYNECWSGDKGGYRRFPFILKYDSKHKIPWCLDYAGWDEESEDRVNLHLKTIRKGETFTFFECSETPALESIYQIVSVHEL